jgi:hypothetical protein
MWMLNRNLQTSVGQTQPSSPPSTKLIFSKRRHGNSRGGCACWSNVENYKWQIASPDDDNVRFSTGSPPVSIIVQTKRVKATGLQLVSAMYVTGFLGCCRILYVTAIKRLHVVEIEYFKLYLPSIYQLSCTTPCFYTHFLLLRVSVFTNTIFRELQSNYSSFTAHQIFLRNY